MKRRAGNEVCLQETTPHEAKSEVGEVSRTCYFGVKTSIVLVEGRHMVRLTDADTARTALSQVEDAGWARDQMRNFLSSKMMSSNCKKGPREVSEQRGGGGKV